MDIVNKIIEFEQGELNDDEIIELFEQLYITNALQGLQGTYQRTFKDLLEQNLINIQQLNKKKRIFEAEKQI